MTILKHGKNELIVGYIDSTFRNAKNTIIVHAKQTLQYLNSIRVDKPVLNLAKLEKSVVFGRLFHEFSTL